MDTHTEILEWAALGPPPSHKTFVVVGGVCFEVTEGTPGIQDFRDLQTLTQGRCRRRGLGFRDDLLGNHYGVKGRGGLNARVLVVVVDLTPYKDLETANWECHRLTRPHY